MRTMRRHAARVGVESDACAHHVSSLVRAATTRANGAAMIVCMGN